jgi:hypothetical protein
VSRLVHRRLSRAVEPGRLTAFRAATCARAPRPVTMRPVVATVLSVHPFGDRLEPGRGAGFVVLVAFLVAFLAIRTSARLTRSVSWWPGGVQAGGVHLHHLVWGICLMILCGFLAFAAPLQAPWWHLIAAGFGVGVGFTLDEFALWVHLRDVYWSEEGRSSFDAVVVALSFAALVVVGTRPFGLDDPASVWGTVAAVAGVLVLVCAAAAKGRAITAAIGIFIPVFGVVGAVRLARPSSMWARRFYDDIKLDRAARRYAPTGRLSRLGARLSDLVAGAPTDEERK